MLHVAPEPCLASRLRQCLGAGYLSVDLLNQAAMMRVDVTAIPFPEGYFDVILCSHVLEHVPEDRKALGEFFRVLNKGGWAALQVPISAEKTVENSSLATPEERRKAFGQEDHVRRYGPDFAERLRQAGFHVDSLGLEDLCDEREAGRFGLTAASGRIFSCRK